MHCILNIGVDLLMRGTTIRITEETHSELNRIKGSFLMRNGYERSFDEVIQQLIAFWKENH